MGKLSEEIILITGIAVSLSVIAIGVISLFMVYRNRQLQSIREREKMQSDFNQQLLQSRLEMQEQTFNNISSELHDNVGQILSLAKVQLNIIGEQDKLDREILAEAKESLSKAMTDLRDIAKSLSSERVQSMPLAEITKQELRRLNHSGIITTSFTTTGLIKALSEQKKLIIFRIIQEAFQNILKHAQAKNIDVIFSYEADRLKIDIADNGKGFNKELLTAKDGLGLSNIMNRASLIGGQAIVESVEDKGTNIIIITPYG
jgi:signal transduction histidine kinase